MLCDKLTRDLSAIVAVGVPAPRPAWNADILRDPAGHFSAGTLADTPENRDILAHVFLRHVEAPPPDLKDGERHGDKVPAIDAAAGLVRWSRPVVAKSPAEIAADAAADAARLEVLEAELCRRVDADAEAARLRWITGGAGQAAIYLRKEQEADAIRIVEGAGGVPVAANYPMISAEAARLGATLSARAAEIRATRDAWLAIAARIEAERQGAKADIRTARKEKDEAAMRAAAAINWPNP